MTRDEHLKWCKDRAHEYLAIGDIKNAITSMMSDLDKHDETRCSNPFLIQLGMLAAMNNDRNEAKRFIDGFN